jgi:hypothetical protein
MQTYIKLYFSKGIGNFYSLDADENTLRGLFILHGKGHQNKKIQNQFWKSISAVSCSVDGQQKVKGVLNHNFQAYFESESKYFGRLSFFTTQEHKQKFELEEKNKYPDRELAHIYMKHMGRTLEDMESRMVEEIYDIYYPKVEDVCPDDPR